MPIISKRDVATFIIACLNQLEASGYQEFEDGEDGYADPVISAGVEFGNHTRESLYVKVDGQEFIVRVTKPKHRNP